MLKLVSTVLALLASSCLATIAKAQGFFAGKTLTILVNYDAGGPTDTEARVLARAKSEARSVRELECGCEVLRARRAHRNSTSAASSPTRAT